MSEAIVKVDTKAIEQLVVDIEKAKRAMLGRLAERGYQVLRAEVPVETGNLKQGVAPPQVDYARMQAELTVSARSGLSAGGAAEVFGADGKLKKVVTLRPSPAYNYAEVVARGNVQATLTPTHARAFLIPVPFAPTGEGYVMAGGKFFVFRRSRRGQAANPFDERAAVRLEAEAPGIGDAVLREFV